MTDQPGPGAPQPPATPTPAAPATPLAPAPAVPAFQGHDPARGTPSHGEKRPSAGSHRSRRRRRLRDRAKQGLALLPSLLTLGNLVCGFYAIIHVASIQWVNGAPTPQHTESFKHAAIAIFLAMLFDMLDGRVARMMRVTSDFGGQLDSLADAVTFGVAPGVMVAMMHSRAAYNYESDLWSRMAWVFGAAYACGAVVRLARFNVETTSHDEDAHKYFKGLPSPAAAGVIATLVLLHTWITSSSPRAERLAWAKSALVDIPQLLPFVALGVGYLMVSSFRYVHFANVFLRGRKPAEYLTGAIFGGVLFALFPEVSAALLFCGFALTGPLGAFRRWMSGAPATPAVVAAQAPATPTLDHAPGQAPPAPHAPPAPQA